MVVKYKLTSEGIAKKIHVVTEKTGGVNQNHIDAIDPAYEYDDNTGETLLINTNCGLKRCNEFVEFPVWNNIEQNTYLHSIYLQLIYQSIENWTFDKIDKLTPQIKYFEKEQNEKQKRSEYYTLNSRSKEKIRQRINSYYYHLERKKDEKGVRFMTLTVPPYSGELSREEKDKLINKVLRKYINTLRKRWGLIDYLYVMERTQKNEVHFHFIVKFENDYADYNRLSAYWVYLLNKHDCQFEIWNKATIKNRIKGIIKPTYINKQGKEVNKKNTELRKQLLAEIKQLSDGKTLTELIEYIYNQEENIKRLIKVNGLKSVKQIYAYLIHGSVNFENVYTLSGLASYLTKYITKNETQSVVRVWACSKKFSSLRTEIQITEFEYNQIKADKSVYRINDVAFSYEMKSQKRIVNVVNEYVYLDKKELQKGKSIFNNYQNVFAHDTQKLTVDEGREIERILDTHIDYDTMYKRTKRDSKIMADKEYKHVIKSWVYNEYYYPACELHQLFIDNAERALDEGIALANNN